MEYVEYITRRAAWKMDEINFVLSLGKVLSWNTVLTFEQCNSREMYFDRVKARSQLEEEWEIQRTWALRKTERDGFIQPQKRRLRRDIATDSNSLKNCYQEEVKKSAHHINGW